MELFSVGWLQNICRGCFAFTCGVSVRTISRRISEWRDGLNVWERAGTTGDSEGRYTERGARVRIWLEDLREELGDKSPDREDILLPPCSKSDYYRDYVNEVKEACVKLPTFLKIWRCEFPTLKVPRQKRLGKCKDCAHLREQLGICKTPAEKEVLREKRREHIKRIRIERKYYHRNRAFAKENPKDLLVIIIDGMDKKKTCIPSFFEHDGDDMEKLKVRIIGAIAHGRPNPKYAFLVTRYTSETNTNISCLLQVRL